MGKLYLMYITAYATGMGKTDPSVDALDQAAAFALADYDRRSSHPPRSYATWLAAWEEHRPPVADRGPMAVGQPGSIARAALPGEIAKHNPGDGTKG